MPEWIYFMKLFYLLKYIMENKRLLYIAPMGGGISFSDVSYEIFRVFKDKIDYDRIDIYVFIVGVCKSLLKVDLSEMTGLASDEFLY